MIDIIVAKKDHKFFLFYAKALQGVQQIALC